MATKIKGVFKVGGSKGAKIAEEVAEVARTSQEVLNEVGSLAEKTKTKVQQIVRDKGFT